MRRLGTATALAAGILVCAGCGATQGAGEDDGDWTPEGDVEIAVGAQPGGGSDILGREFAAGFEEQNGVTAVVENYDTVEGVLLLKRDPTRADIVGVGNTANMIVRPSEQDLGYTWEDFTQLAVVAEDVSYVVARAGAFASAEEMIEAGGDRDLTVGQVGSGSGDTLIAEQLASAFDLEFAPVVYEGGGDVIRGVISGDVDIAVLEPTEFLPQVEAGELDVLLSTGATAAPHELLKDVPLASEMGASEPFATQYRLFFAASELTDGQKDYWIDALTEWTESQAYADYVDANALTPTLLTGDDVDAALAESVETLTGEASDG